jgi:hypothetical protein
MKLYAGHVLLPLDFIGEAGPPDDSGGERRSRQAD